MASFATSAATVGTPVSRIPPLVRAAGFLRHPKELALLELADHHAADVVAVVRLAGLGGVAGDRTALDRADADAEHRHHLLLESLERRAEVALHALAVGEDEHRLIAPLALALERLGGGVERGGEVGGRVAEIVAARGVEEELERTRGRW